MYFPWYQVFGHEVWSNGNHAYILFQSQSGDMTEVYIQNGLQSVNDIDFSYISCTHVDKTRALIDSDRNS